MRQEEKDTGDQSDGTFNEEWVKNDKIKEYFVQGGNDASL